MMVRCKGIRRRLQLIIVQHGIFWTSWITLRWVVYYFKFTDTSCKFRNIHFTFYLFRLFITVMCIQTMASGPHSRIAKKSKWKFHSQENRNGQQMKCNCWDRDRLSGKGLRLRTFDFYLLLWISFTSTLFLDTCRYASIIIHF